MDDVLRRLYYDTKTGFIGPSKLYKKARAVDPSITMAMVKKFVEAQATAQIHKPVVKDRNPQHIVGPIGQWNIDLMFFTAFKQQNRGYHIILTAIEINSKYALAYPLKSKQKQVVADTIEQLVKDIRSSDRKIVYLHSDRGSEFKNDLVSELCERLGIQQIFCREGDHRCNGIIERFNKTLRGLLAKYMTYKRTVKWTDSLDSLIENYNNTDHGALPDDKTPAEITEEDELDIIFDKYKHNFNIINKSIPLSVGDKVRLQETKGAFAKGGHNYSRDVFIVEKVNGKSVRIGGVEGSRTVPRAKLLKVSQDTEVEHKTKDPREEAIKKSRVSRRLSREGIH